MINRASRDRNERGKGRDDIKACVVQYTTAFSAIPPRFEAKLVTTIVVVYTALESLAKLSYLRNCIASASSSFTSSPSSANGNDMPWCCALRLLPGPGHPCYTPSILCTQPSQPHPDAFRRLRSLGISHLRQMISVAGFVRSQICVRAVRGLR